MLLKGKRWLAAAMMGLWAAVIFGTSCTVIRPQELFGWLQKYVLTEPESIRRFQLFWAGAWIFVVKGWHVCEFAILMVLAVRAVDRILGCRTRNHVLWAGLACLVFAASDEWHQTFVPGRGGLFTDVAIDSLGILLAGICMGRNRPRFEPGDEAEI